MVFKKKIRNLNNESSNTSVMEKVLDNYVEEVYTSFSYNGEILTFDEWQKWLFTINGIDKILDFTGILKYN